MPIVLLSKLLGRLLAWMPLPSVACGARLIGWMLYHLPVQRSRAMKSNLHHAFPEKDDAWRKRVGKQTSARLVEMALYALASPFLSRRWFETHLRIPDDVRTRMEEASQGAIILLPHVTLFEMMSAVPAVFPGAEGHSAVYRPLDNAALDDWIRQSRERWGICLLSRRDGVNQMIRSLRTGRCLTLLFDQNTGKRGNLFFFFQRLASGTHLPGLLARKCNLPAYLLLPRRTGFWTAELAFDPLPQPEKPTDLVFTSHGELERYLSASESQAADWLWYHNRWGRNDRPRNRFFIRKNDNYLERSCRFAGLSRMPRRTRLWFRMPNWLGDVVMALPLIRAVREGRPDAEITLLAQAAFRPLFQRVAVADRLIDLPDRSAPWWKLFPTAARLRKEFPDACLCLTNSMRGDLEALLTGCPQRLGMRRPGRGRPLLTDVWEVPSSMDETRCHQLEVWEAMFRYFGLQVPLSRAPLREHAGGEGIGFMCGTENTPAKRWPVDHWRDLLERLLEHTAHLIFLYGTRRDREITGQVARGFDQGRVKNLAGETDLEQFLDHLSSNRAVICHDSGGMHLANMLGIPVFAIFGPTNPLRTGPVFHVPWRVLQPPGCPPTGGHEVGQVSVDQVWEAWQAWERETS